uniref:DEP domain-containing mTOR-interacting protein isoform X1 n=2 Tax=Petromyzon marinus TaxID=7757 RepID=A0AAJ7UG92_PETMA|nr:DEP domain-containing mTOR-interacting protein isoform X1 [Petromyzon marinus]XP_032835734.1 DEP domain-containing mTOR-interacting protein isoform X1 [Petromyzon marinus]
MDDTGYMLKKDSIDVDVFLIGDQLRQRMHKEKVIKDRRHHLRTYPNCFVGRELVDWLFENEEVVDRGSAVCCMQVLMAHNIVHHVSDEHKDFKDAKLFYRFRRDDGTYPLNYGVRMFLRGQRIFEKLHKQNSPVLHARGDDVAVYELVFIGFQLVTWLVWESEAMSREDATRLCQRMFEQNIIRNISPADQFLDRNLVYFFRLDFQQDYLVTDLVPGMPTVRPNVTKESRINLRKQLLSGCIDLSSFLTVNPAKEIVMRRNSVSNSSTGTTTSNGYWNAILNLSSSPPPMLYMPRSVLKRPVSVEELLMAGAPFLKKTLTVLGDAVGWGFVVRGAQPCHIQAVDPSGPAATAGMKVCQFVVSVNGHNVLSLDYRTLSNLILTGPSTIVLEVMEDMV